MNANFSFAVADSMDDFNPISLSEFSEALIINNFEKQMELI